MKKVMILALSLALAGCFGTMPKTVYIPVPEPCKVEIPAEPQYMFSPPYDDVFVASQHLLGDNKAKDGYIAQLKAAVKSCK